MQDRCGKALHLVNRGAPHMTVRSHGEGRRRKTRGGVTVGVRGEGRVGDGAVETKQKQNNMKRFLSGKGEAGDAGGRPRPVTQRYTKKRRDKRAWLGVRHKVSEH